MLMASSQHPPPPPVLNESALARHTGTGLSVPAATLGLMELRPGYHEWAPPAALRPAVSCLWTSVVPDSEPTLVLPDGCTDIIWQQGYGVFVAGPDTGPAPAVLPPGTMLAGVRLRPGAGGPVLGLPLAELRDQRANLADVRPDLAGQLPGGDLTPGQALGRLIAVTAGLAAAGPPDPLVSRAARLLATSRERTDELATELGLSDRQFRRRCLDVVGYGPKALHRILRFRRFVSRIDAAGPGADLALIAAEAGYADQAHLTRETRRLAGRTPLELVSSRATPAGERLAL
jgi:AraC-like DNA-binding protein